MTEVVCGLVQRDGRILIGQRRLDAAAHAGKWEFPGGKIEPGESPEQALRRELREELAIDCGPVREVHRYEFTYPGKKPVFLRFLQVDSFTGEPVNQVFAQIKWAAISDLPSFDFVEGDLEFLTWLARRKASDSPQIT